MPTVMSGDELVALVRRVFQPTFRDHSLAVMVDLPDAKIGDNARWKTRRELALGWATALAQKANELQLTTHLVLYRNVHTNNGELPESCWLYQSGPLPERAEALDPQTAISFNALFSDHQILIAPTEFSATAPLKLAAKQAPIRAATMPGFSPEMIPALRLDYGEVNRRVSHLKTLLDRAQGASILFEANDAEHRLHLDLRYRSAHASGGLFPNPGAAGNLPSGEAYIVPYEGERSLDPSTSKGSLPVQFGDEVVVYRICENRAVEVLSKGEAAQRERALLAKEPAYGNLAELGLGVLADFGVKPVGELLLDEKLGLHIAFGRSDHFGGQVGPKSFSGPEAVVHIDRVYVPETQPLVLAAMVDLEMEGGAVLPLMRKGRFVVDFR